MPTSQLCAVNKHVYVSQLGTKFSTPLSHHISMISYLFSLIMVTTHALHLT